MIARKILGKLSQIFFVGYSYCGHCGLTWNVTKYHATQYAVGHGCFPLCEHCWSRLTPNERLPYYKQLTEEWGQPELFDAMKNAVMDGR